MATNPKMKPCPKCGTDDHLAVYTYESGWKHVECVECNYFGPGEGTIRQAIKSHNKRYDERAAPCECCGPGKSTGLPSNACENCMNTGLKYPQYAPSSDTRA